MVHIKNLKNKQTNEGLGESLGKPWYASSSYACICSGACVSSCDSFSGGVLSPLILILIHCFRNVLL